MVTMTALRCGQSVHFFFHDPAPTLPHTLSLHDALPIYPDPREAQIAHRRSPASAIDAPQPAAERLQRRVRSEEHTSELQSRGHLVCRLLLEKKKTSLLPPMG